MLGIWEKLDWKAGLPYRVENWTKLAQPIQRHNDLEEESKILRLIHGVKLWNA